MSSYTTVGESVASSGTSAGSSKSKIITLTSAAKLKGSMTKLPMESIIGVSLIRPLSLGSGFSSFRITSPTELRFMPVITTGLIGPSEISFGPLTGLIGRSSS